MADEATLSIIGTIKQINSASKNTAEFIKKAQQHKKELAEKTWDRQPRLDRTTSKYNNQF